MCEFVSWIEKGGEVFFLTTADIESKRGKELREYCKNNDDLKGHGAIRWFFDLEGGEEYEITNFYTTKKIPAIIIEDIKAGKFYRWFGPVPNGILNEQLYAKYIKNLDTLNSNHEKNCTPLDSEHEKNRNALYSEYWNIFVLDAKYNFRNRDALYDEYKKNCIVVDNEYMKSIASFHEDYMKSLIMLYEDYWGKVKIKKNRSKAWQ